MLGSDITLQVHAEKGWCKALELNLCTSESNVDCWKYNPKEAACFGLMERKGEIQSWAAAGSGEGGWSRIASIIAQCDGEMLTSSDWSKAS